MRLSKREHALELCHGLLEALDGGRISPSSALIRFLRIAQLIGDDKLVHRIKSDLDGYALGSSPDDLKRQLRDYVKKHPDKNIDIDKIVKDAFALFPNYRVLSLEVEDQHRFKTVYMNGPLSKYEELLAGVRKNTKVKYTLSDGGVKLYPTAVELNKLVAGARQWVYEELVRLCERLEFGQIPLGALETTFDFVDSQLFEIAPEAAERLIVAYRNLAEKSEENWINVVDTCRRVIKSFADAVFPPQDEPVGGVVVTEDKYLNRIRTFIKQTIESRRQKDQLISVLYFLGELLSRTDNLASRSVHLGKVSRFEAERILIYTYLAIGDILVLCGVRPRTDAATERPNLNDASYEELKSKLALSAEVASEVIKYRKYRRFESWSEVSAIKGIGPKMLKKLRAIASL